MTIQPVDLRVEHDPAPTNVPPDDPRFSWRIDDTGEQSAYRVLVARSRDRLDRHEGDAWDSGRVASGDSVDVPYDGAPLAGDETYHWTVRVWDGSGEPTPWSDPATFATAPDREPAGEWIGYQPDGGDSAGYRSQWQPADEGAEEWVQVDLGSITEFRTVELHPAEPITGPETPDGVTVPSSGWGVDKQFGFPEAFRVEAANDPSFDDSRVLADVTFDEAPADEDVQDDETIGDVDWTEPRAVDVGPVAARYVRVVAMEPWVYDPPGGRTEDVDTRRDVRSWSLFALAAFAVRGGDGVGNRDGSGNGDDGTDLAVGRPVRASSSHESEAWGRDRLVDGSYESGFASGSPLLGKEFDLSGTVERARVHVAALGYGELYVNGERVGDAVLDPGWTDYRERVLYTTHDVTDQLREGANALGLWLGRGWYASGGALWTSLGSPRALVELTVEYADGRTRRLTTDDGWRATASPIVENDIYDGEVYDAREVQPGWAEPDFDDSGWDRAARVDAPDGRLWPQQGPPIRVVEELEPVELIDHEEGPIVDFGQNHTGWIELAVEGADAGDEIRLRHAEALTGEGDLSTTDLRSADATDVYVARGDDRETYEPRFTYHGYRYAQVTDYPGELTADDVRSKVVHTDFESIGTFECANEDLERVHRNSRWGLRGNAHGVPTDCPQRDERFGWTGDAQLAARALMYNFDARGFHEKWLRDHDDAQAPAGYLPPVVPQTNATAPSDPSWTVTRVVLPWYLYCHYGDEAVLAAHYEEMRRYVDYWHSVADDGIVPKAYGSYGDWLAFENNDGSRGLPLDLFNTAHHYQTTQLFGEIADLLGYAADAARYGERAEAIAAVFNERFLDAEAATYEPGTQAASAVALFYGIAPENLAEEIASNLAERVHDAGGTLQTGFLGTRALIHALADHGQVETAYEVISQPDQPGWVYMVRNGATTVWERWDSDQQVGSGMNSLNHSPFTLISEWFYRVLAGIRFEKQFATDRQVTIAPAVVDQLDWAGASVETPYGEVRSRWERTDEGVTLRVEVPWNVTAAVEVSAEENPTVRLGDVPVWDGGPVTDLPDGVEEVHRGDDGVTVVVASGSHEIRAE